jgi:hypothetical protein
MAAERLRSDLPLGGGALKQTAMNHLRKIGLASFFFLGLGLASGAFPGSPLGWTPQTATMIAVICYCIGLVLALIAFMQSRRGQSLDGTTKFLARGPLALVTIGVLFFFLRAMTGL